MKWNEAFTNDKMPTFEEIERYIDRGAKLWIDLCSYLEETYQIKPQMSYSKCSAQPGWNIKYSKSGKSLCTLYPMEGYFIALVVIGAKEETEVELALESFTSYIFGLYNKTPFSCGGRWLMIEVKDDKVLDDVKRLISMRVKPRSR